MPAQTNEIHVNDIGTAFVLTFQSYNSTTEESEPVDISDPSAIITIYFLKPDDSVMERTAVVSSGGLDGKAHYASVDGDLDQEGRWVIQGKVLLPGGEWSSNLDSFRVHSNIWG